MAERAAKTRFKAISLITATTWVLGTTTWALRTSIQNNAQFGANLNLNTLNAKQLGAERRQRSKPDVPDAAVLPEYVQQHAKQHQRAGGSTSQTNQGNPGLGFLGGWQLANGWGK